MYSFYSWCTNGITAIYYSEGGLSQAEVLDISSSSVIQGVHLNKVWN